MLGRLHSLQPLAGEISGESFSPVEMAAFLFERWELAWRILRKVWLREQVEKTGSVALPYRPQEQNFSPRPRPAAILSRLNRSRIFPPLVLPEATLPAVQVREILQIVRQAHAEGESWPRLLDVLVTSSGLSWDIGAILLEKITGRRLLEEEIMIVARARQFWQYYAEGRARMVALQAAKEIPVCQGDWAHFSRSQFADLLPGTVLPDHYERHEFLVNYVQTGGEQSVDVYSITGQALFQHPFPCHFFPRLG